MEKIISKDGTPIAFWRSGKGPPLVLVHGSTADHSTTWKFVLPELEMKFKCFAVDRRGRGGSGDSKPYYLQREAEDIVAIVDSIGEPVNLLGHSYGGLCAIEASLLTSNLRKLILYEGVTLNGAKIYRPGFIERLETILKKGDVEGIIVTMLRELLNTPSHEIDMLRQDGSWKVRVANAPTIPRECRAESQYVFEPERFKHMRIPTILLVGSESPAYQQRDAEGVARALPNGRVVILPGQGHAAMHTASDLFLREVLRFLEAKR